MNLMPHKATTSSKVRDKYRFVRHYKAKMAKWQSYEDVPGEQK